jgi:hypothetical protein
VKGPFLALVVAAGCVPWHVAASTQAPQAPAPPQPAPVASPDPAAVQFASPVGLLLVAVKPDKVADYEAVLTALQQAFQETADPERRAMAQGWRVYKAAEANSKKHVLYVHALAPAVAGADYRPSVLLDELLKGAPPGLLAKYRETFAAPPTKLSLTEFAHMAVAPVGKH